MKQQNKVVAITGATGGIGRDLVKLLDKKGARQKLFGGYKASLDKMCRLPFGCRATNKCGV